MVIRMLPRLPRFSYIIHGVMISRYTSSILPWKGNGPPESDPLPPFPPRLLAHDSDMICFCRLQPWRTMEEFFPSVLNNSLHIFKTGWIFLRPIFNVHLNYSAAFHSSSDPPHVVYQWTAWNFRNTYEGTFVSAQCFKHPWQIHDDENIFAQVPNKLAKSLTLHHWLHFVR